MSTTGFRAAVFTQRPRIGSGGLKLCALILLVCLCTAPAAAQRHIDGIVVDVSTGVPIPGVHVFEQGTGRGTVTSTDGRFDLELADLPARLVAQHIGYKPLILDVSTAASLTLRLDAAVLELEELVVSGENPGTRIMRHVLERKQRMFAELRSFAAVAYTRLLLERSGTIEHVSDAAFDWTWHRDGESRSVVSARSSTSEWHLELPLPPVASMLNLYDDVVAIQGLDLIGPTHPRTLEYYVFRVAGERDLGAYRVIDLNVSPRDERHATFVGQISVVDGTFAMLEVRLRPARHVVFPEPVVGWDVRYHQHFRQMNDSLWLPINLYMEGSLREAVDVRTVRVVELSRRSMLSGHRVNAASESDVAVPFNDPRFRVGEVLMPMTAREQEAVERLSAAALTLREAFPPITRSDLLARFLDPETGLIRWPNVLGYRFKFRYNRVDGILSSVGQESPPGAPTPVTWSLGQSSHYARIRSHVTLGLPLTADVRARLAYDRDLIPRISTSMHPSFLTSLQSALGGGDYHDFLWRSRVEAELSYERRGATMFAGAVWDRDESVGQQLRRSWPVVNTFRPNPEIADGRYVVLTSGMELAGTGMLPHVALRVDLSDRRFGSAASFTRISGRGEWSIPTLARGRPRPAQFHALVVAGRSMGPLPPQWILGLDASLLLFDAVRIDRWGALRSLDSRPLEGDHTFAAFWRHDLTTLPFEVLKLWPLVRHETGVAIVGGHGRTWLSTGPPRTANRFIHELGVSLNPVLDTPLRVDLTFRLDAPGTRIGFGIRH